MHNNELALPRSLSDIFTSPNIPPVFDILFLHLSFQDLIRVSWTCKGGRDAIHSYRRRAFSLNRLLQRFFNDPSAFRSLQERTGTIISGSQALQLIGRLYWPTSDLDLYTTDSYGATLEVGQWLLDHGYRFVPHKYQEHDFHDTAMTFSNLPVHPVWDLNNPVDVKTEQLYSIHAIRAVYAFEKSDPDTLEHLKIQIIAPHFSALDVILNFHSTAVMNFITWDKAYSLYPYATFEKSRSLICFVPKTPCPRYDRAMVKYHERGFTMVAGLYTHEDPHCAFHIGPRFVGDQFSCIIPLDIEGVQVPTKVHPSPPPDFDHYMLNGWELKQLPTVQEGNAHHQAYKPETYFYMGALEIWTSILKHKYTAEPPTFIPYIISFFRRQGQLEHAKLSEEDATFYAGKGGAKPAYWRYYDKEFQEIIQHWIRSGNPTAPSELD